MNRFEYLSLHMCDTPEDVKQHYQLQHNATDNGYIHAEIQKEIYAPSQVAWLSQDPLESCLKQNGFFQSKVILGLWLYKMHPIQFCFVVDDFGVKYTNGSNAKHL